MNFEEWKRKLANSLLPRGLAEIRNKTGMFYNPADDDCDEEDLLEDG